MTREELRSRAEEVIRLKDEACRACGRGTDEVKILPVTKFVAAEPMKWAQEMGFSEFGENYVQHILAKNEEFPEISWHLIGHLQKNKVKSIVAKIHLLESLDSPELFTVLDRVCADRECGLDVLIQVNIGREPQKTGIMPEQYPALRDAVLAGSRVRLRGLMAVPPAGEDPEPYFEAMKKLYDELKGMCPQADILSMGMSHDYQKAIACGSTMIRVGTAIFGARPTPGGGRI